ncbi:DUF308 domain-containing protein [Marasmitruncus massiliensis]|uniref:DUF308 domain-containing protein n=1 Tax=Marasmitruncus massiliensis TaxID=1944642 RepID=UPI000C7B6B7C|nr:DUF308 domain-containing protein [Marasmitruncus massiliensis]MBE6907098.1 DUF308 domain-containing protein [Oscillospiraceae bacterium]
MNNNFQEFEENESKSAEQADQFTGQNSEDTADTASEQEAVHTEPVKEAYRFPPVPRVHRVGTLTMGFSLIATGIIALISTFYPGFDLTTAFKLSPVIFIFLGIEILIAYFFHKEERIKYDFLSGIVCFFLICGGLVLAALPTVWSYVGPEAQLAREQAESVVENDIYQALQSIPSVESVSVDTDLSYRVPYTAGSDFEKLAARARIHVYTNLTGPFADENAFAEAGKTLLNQLNSLPYQYRSISIEYSDENKRFDLNLSTPFQYQLSTDKLANLVDSDRYEPDMAETETDVELPNEPVTASSEITAAFEDSVPEE